MCNYKSWEIERAWGWGLFFILLLQWAFGITCWEIFSVGKNPYPGVNPSDLPKLLADGQRLEKPINDACHDEM